MALTKSGFIMKRKDLFNYIDINYYSATPKYLQLANAIVKAINDGKLKKDESLPSLNELGDEFEIARATVEKSYKHLKEIGVIASVPGKGYFIKNAQLNNPLKILLLFNKLSPHKKVVYDAFVAHIGETASIDFFIYNNDFSFFKKLLSPRITDYTHYVILPHFMEGGSSVHEIINTIPKNKLVLLDKLVPGVTGEFAAIYENFEKDIYNALEEAKEHLSKYHTIKIIFPEYTHFPAEIVRGFERFCDEYAFKHFVVRNLKKEPLNKGEVFITLMEDDLVVLIERIVSMPLKVGTDVGVISYNESSVKKIILNGITTVSTDFQLMGERAALAILSQSVAHEEIPFHLTLRASL